METDRSTPIRIELDSIHEEEYRPRTPVLASMALCYYRNNATTNLAMPIVIR